MSDDDHLSGDRPLASLLVCGNWSLPDRLGTDLVIEAVSFAVDVLA